MLLVMSFVLDLLSMFVTGFCGMILWNWYIPSFFDAVPPLTFLAAMGLFLVASVFVSSGKSYKKEDMDSTEGVLNLFLTQLVNGVSKPITLVFFGWLVQVFA